MADHETEAGSATADAGSESQGTPSTRPPARNVPLAIGWAVVVAIGGGLLCGLAISEFRDFGSVLLWPLGFVGGWVARRMMRGANRFVAWCLVAACFVALVIADVYLIRWNWLPQPEGWGEAIKLLPDFVSAFKISAAVHVAFTAFGAWSAYQQTAHRYRLVAVVDD